MKIVIAGGTGFVGQYLVRALLGEQHNVVLLSRSPESDRQTLPPQVQLVQWDGKQTGTWIQEVEGADAVINLAGKSIFTRWSDTTKKKILGSRIQTVRLLNAAIEQAQRKPSVFVSVSAVGYYGNRRDKILTEQVPAGHDFLAEVCVAWEEEAQQATRFGVRVVNPRFGIVLEKNGGALKQLMIPFRLFLGGWLGSGQQWFPWVHMNDVVGGILYTLHHEQIRGAYNFCAPHPVQMKEFTMILGKVMGFPSWLPVPAFIIRLVLGEAALLLLGSQRAIPEALLHAGYMFQFPTAQSALEDILR